MRYVWYQHPLFFRGRLATLRQLHRWPVTNVSGTPRAVARSPMGAPRVEHIASPGEPARIYFHAADGTVWRVYDRAFGPPFAPLYQRRTLPSVGDPRAGYRWFVSRNGSAQLYKFAKGDHRLADAATLEHQLRVAQYPSTSISSADALEGYQRMLAASREKELSQARSGHPLRE